MRIGFYVNESKCRAAEAATRLGRLAAERGLEQVAPADADVVVTLGGDGTILKAVRELPDRPILGFNLGSLGYLSAVAEDGFETALVALAESRYRVAERSMLEVRATTGETLAVALNDVVIQRELSGHAAILELSADGKSSTRYLADGLVIATPTGSTAYSLSAGGPVLMPDSRSLVVTPMNPHALGIRPLVVGDTVTLTVVVRRRANAPAEKIGVYADGGEVKLLAADEPLVIVRAAHGARLVELEGYDPYAVLSHKLGWTGDLTR